MFLFQTAKVLHEMNNNIWYLYRIHSCCKNIYGKSNVYVSITVHNSSCGKLMVLQVSVCLSMGGVCPRQTLPRQTPQGRHLLGRHPLGRHPQADIPPRWTSPLGGHPP